MKFSTEEKTLLMVALSIAMDNAPTQTRRWAYYNLRSKIERGNRNHLTLVETDPPDEAA